MAEREQLDTRATHWGGLAAGLMAAGIVAWWSRPDMDPGVSPARAAMRGALWLLGAVIAGTLGMMLAGGFAGTRGGRRMRAAMNAAAVWLLIPPLLLLFVEASPKLLALVAGMAAGLAVCLWAVAPAVPRDDDEAATAVTGPTFAELPPSKSGARQSALIAVCVEAALLITLRGDPFWGAVWLAFGSLLLAWKALATQARPERRPVDERTRLATAAVAAMAVVVALLLMRPAQETEGRVGGRANPSAQAQERKPGSAVDDAYRGIVLFTVTEKKKELPPVPVQRSLLRADTSRPMVIPFDGSYWYFQAPQHGPGLHPHLAHGDPVAMNIYSTGWVPLAMQAHQTLAQPIPLHGGEGFELTVRNGDNRPGRIDVGVLLTDSRSPDLEKPTLVLGVKPLLSSEGTALETRNSAVEEDLRFTIPEHPAVRKFDTITVLFLPSEARETMGARVGIRQFELLPR